MKKTKPEPEKKTGAEDEINSDEIDVKIEEKPKKEKKIVPKKQPTDYNLFVKYQAKHAGLKFDKIGEQWRELTADKKQEIIDAAKKEFL